MAEAVGMDAWGSCRGRSSMSRPGDSKRDGDRKEEEDYAEKYVHSSSQGYPRVSQTRWESSPHQHTPLRHRATHNNTLMRVYRSARFPSHKRQHHGLTTALSLTHVDRSVVATNPRQRSGSRVPCSQQVREETHPPPALLPAVTATLSVRTVIQHGYNQRLSPLRRKERT